MFILADRGSRRTKESRRTSSQRTSEGFRSGVMFSENREKTLYKVS